LLANQTGFIGGLGCGPALHALTLKLRSKKSTILFIDFSSAYNTINRRLLF